MNYKKLIAVVMILALVCSLSSPAFATDSVIIIGAETTTTVTETTDTEQSGGEQSVPGQPEGGTEGTSSEQGTEGTGDNADQTDPADSSPSPEAETSDGSDITPDEINPTIVKHPGDELGRSVGDNIMFTAACTNTQSITWFIDTPTETGIAATDIINHLRGVSAVETPNGAYGCTGSTVTIMGLTNECNNIKVYAQFTLTNGKVLTSNAARITVQGADKIVPTPTPIPTATPAPTPALTPTSAPVPDPVPVVAPARVDVQPVITEQQSTEESDQHDTPVTVGPDGEWSVPGAKTAVAACAAIAIAALVLMILYSTGAVELHGLERLVSGKKARDSYEDEEDDE